MKLGSAEVEITSNNAPLKRGLVAAKADVNAWSRDVRGGVNREMDGMSAGVGSSMGRMAAQFINPVTIVAGVAAAAVFTGKAAFDMALSYEDAFTGVRKTVDATEEQFAELSAGIRQMSNTIPASREAIAGVAEAAGQLGIKREAILSFSKTMIDLGNTTNLKADQAATSLARLANITQMPQTEFGRLGSTVVELGNKLESTEAEIVDMGLRLAGAGRQVGMTEAEILSLAGAISSVGIESEMGGSAMSRLMADMGKAVGLGGDELEEFAKVAGMSGDAFSQMFKSDAIGAIIAFVEGLGQIKETGGNVFKTLEDLGLSEVRMRGTLLSLAGTGDAMRKSLEIGNRAWRENIALTEEAEKRYGTTSSKLQVLSNRMSDGMVRAFEANEGPMNGFISGLLDVTETARGNEAELARLMATGLSAADAMLALQSGAGGAAGAMAGATAAASGLNSQLALFSSHGTGALTQAPAGLEATFVEQRRQLVDAQEQREADTAFAYAHNRAQIEGAAASDAADLGNRVQGAAGLIAAEENRIQAIKDRAAAEKEADSAAKSAASEAKSAASAAESAANKMASDARQAANEVEQAIREGITKAADEARKAVGKLNDAWQALRDTPLKGTKGFEDQEFALSQQLTGAKLRLRNQRDSKAPRADIRATEKQIEEIEGRIERLGYQRTLTMDPAQRKLGQAVNPPLPERTLGDLLADINLYRPAVAAAGAAIEREDSGTATAIANAVLGARPVTNANTLNLTFNLAGSEPDLPQAIVDKIAAAFGVVNIPVSTELPGAR